MRKCLLLLLLFFVWNQAAAQFHDFDKRLSWSTNQSVAASSAQLQAAAVLKNRARGAVVENNPTQRQVFISRRGGFLSGVNGEGLAVPVSRARRFSQDDPHRPVKAFLDEYSSLVGHDASALDSARVKREFVGNHNGMRTVVWQQQRDGIPVFEAVLIAHTTKRGELVNICDRFHGISATVSSRRTTKTVIPQLPVEDAIAAAAAGLDVQLDLQRIMALSAASGLEKKQRLRASGLLGEIHVALTWLPMDSADMRLCWDVILTEPVNGEMFRVLVDAETGDVLLRRCLTVSLSDASYRVYTNDSPSPFSPGHAEPMTNQPPLVGRSLVTWSALNTNASPAGWISDGENSTLGNNVDAHLDRDHDNEPDPGSRPEGSPFRVFDFDLDLTQAPEAYTNASVVQLFYWCNWMHDQLYTLGFTEEAGNFQTDNFGRGGEGGDALQADAQDGLGFNNANMSTPPDGLPPRMQMYLWSGPDPDRDGCLDAEIVLHEYTHGLSQRLVGGGVGLYALQADGLSEGWSDFYALSLLGGPDDDPHACYTMGGYATYMMGGLTQNYYFGIRRYPYVTDMTRNPLTFKDIDPTQVELHNEISINPVLRNTPDQADEEHRMGEVWCVALWEIRANLIDKYGFAGNQLALQLVTDGMTLSPANPNFLQARDAIIQADLINNDGANSIELWTAFAKRGMGYSAVSPESSTTEGLIEAYDLPNDLLITPSSVVIFRGLEGGPFSPSGATYAITNRGESALSWSVSKTQSWLTVSETSGTLSAGETQDIDISINAGASTLPLGIYTDTLVFSNLQDSVPQFRTVQLRVVCPTNVIIRGAARVTARSVNAYSCYVQYTDGLVSNVTDSSAWSIVGDPHDTAVNGNILSVGETASDAVVTIQAACNGFTNTCSVSVENVPAGLSGLSKLFDEPTADVEDVVYFGGYVYAACGYAGLIVCDVSDPEFPVRVGGYDTDGFARAVTVQAGRVLIADDRDGLLVMDVSNPVNPVLEGKYETHGYCYDITGSGDYAYMAASTDGLLVFDVSTLSDPRLVGSCTAGVSCAWGLAVDGNYAYVADYTNGLKVIDISNPSDPVLTGSSPVSGQARNVVVQGGYAYVAAYANGLQIIDVSNPSSPNWVGGYETHYSSGLAISAPFICLANGSAGLEVINVNNPADPVPVQVVDKDDGMANNLFFSGAMAYVANDYGGVQVVRVSYSTGLSVEGTCDTHRDAYDVAVKGSYAYIAGYRDGLITVDVSNPASPSVVDKNKWALHPEAWRVDISGDTLCVAASSDGLVIYDLSNPDSPGLVTKYDFVSVGYISDVKISGDYVFCANGSSSSTNSLGIIDISDPEHPVYAGGYNAGGSVWELDVQGRYAYLASYTNGLQIFDISSPESPVLKGVYERTSARISVSGNYAYVLDVENVLHIVDIQNPESPTLQKEVELGAVGYLDSDIFARYPYVYIAYGDGMFPTNCGLRVVDISDMDNPVVTSYPTSGFGRGVAVSGGFIYLADDPELLHVCTLGGRSSDSDMDDIPDWWESRYFGSITNAAPASICANGVNSMHQAYIAGLSPVDPAAGFGLTCEHNAFSWNAVSGRVYSVYWTTNLLESGFQCIQSNLPWTTNSFPNIPDYPYGYYKIDVRMEE